MLQQGHLVRAHFNLSSDGIDVYLFNHNERGERLIPSSINWDAAPDSYLLAPTFRLPSERAQQLMDDLWSAGIRPAAGRQSEGVTAAQARHLEDMRAIAFAKLNITKPERI